MMNRNVTKNVIDFYVKNYTAFSDENLKETDNEKKEYMEFAFKSKIYDDIKLEIIEEEKKRILEESAIENKTREQNLKVKQIKILMYEGFAVAFVIGLIVNQATELLGLLKKDETKELTTLVIIAILLLITFLVYNFKLVSEVGDIIKNKKK